MGILIGLCFLFTTTTLQAQNQSDNIIRQWVNDEELKHAKVGIHLVSVKNNQILASYNDQMSLQTASSLKVVTTATALQRLGADFTFTNSLFHNGAITENKVLKGDIVFYSDGDPGFISEHFSHQSGRSEADIKKSIVNAFKGRVTKIEGDVIIDASYYGSQAVPPTWDYQDLGNYYACGTWSVSIFDNSYKLNLSGHMKTGQPVHILSSNPSIPDLNFVSELTTGTPTSGDQAYIYCPPYTEIAYVRGTIPSGRMPFVIKGSIPNTPKFLGIWLKNTLKENGIEVTGNVRVNYQPSDIKKQLIWSYSSPTLEQYIELINKKSINLFAEALFKRLAKEDANGDAVNYIKAHWQELGLTSNGIFMEDGSGLSARNSVPASFLAQLMRKSIIHPHAGSVFRKSLSIGGKDGTAKSMFLNTVLQEKIHLKSGYFNRVRTYVGFFESAQGEIAFAVLVNDYTCSASQMRKKIEKLLVTLASID